MRQMISLFRRRSQPTTAAGKRPAAGKRGCAHWIKRWKQVPHPRYGKRVPYFVAWLDVQLCDEVGCRNA